MEDKSDEELIAISSGRIPPGMVGAGSTTTPEELIIRAKVILHGRRKKIEKRTIAVTKWTRAFTIGTLAFTIVITLLTAILVYFAFLDRRTSNPADKLMPSQPSQVSPEHKDTQPANAEKHMRDAQ